MAIEPPKPEVKLPLTEGPEAIKTPVPKPGGGDEADTEEETQENANNNNPPASPKPDPTAYGRAGKPGSAEDTNAWTQSLVERAQNINTSTKAMLSNSKPSPQKSAKNDMDAEEKRKRDEENKEKIKEGLDQAATEGIKSGNPDAAAAGAGYKAANAVTGGQVGDKIAGTANALMTEDQKNQLNDTEVPSSGPKGPMPKGMGG